MHLERRAKTLHFQTRRLTSLPWSLIPHLQLAWTRGFTGPGIVTSSSSVDVQRVFQAPKKPSLAVLAAPASKAAARSPVLFYFMIIIIIMMIIIIITILLCFFFGGGLSRFPFMDFLLRF